ncbi:MAG: HAD hydrolase-like protein [Bryobacteraceae bacterium]
MLFDIDGTLIRRAGSHHKLALIEAIRIVIRREASLDGIPTQGMLDCDLFRIMLQRLELGDGAFDENLPSLVREAQRHYIANCPADLRTSVCPGVEPLLDRLREAGVACGVVSGNLSTIGWKKLELAGLRTYFELGAFAEQAVTRTKLASEAIETARSGGLIMDSSKVSLVGDHPNDIRAAHANGIQAIAVATGLSSLDELQNEQPNLLLQDLTSLAVEHLL